MLINKDENNKRYNPRKSWRGWVFSEEIKQAINLFGYSFEIEYGWLFPNETNEYFSSYVNQFFKLISEETGAKRVIANLMLD